MKTENLSTLKIHKLSKEQYDRELAAGRIDETALYLTPDDTSDLEQFVTVDQLEEVANNKINVADIVDNLTTNAPDKPLSAAQGYKLKELAINAHTAAIEAKGVASVAQTATEDAQRVASDAFLAAKVADENAWQAISAAGSKEAAGTAATMLNRTTAVNAADTNYTTCMARGTSLSSTDTAPTVNGCIVWIYG